MQFLNVIFLIFFNCLLFQVSRVLNSNSRLYTLFQLVLCINLMFLFILFFYRTCAPRFTLLAIFLFYLFTRRIPKSRCRYVSIFRRRWQLPECYRTLETQRESIMHELVAMKTAIARSGRESVSHFIAHRNWLPELYKRINASNKYTRAITKIISFSLKFILQFSYN